MTRHHRRRSKIDVKPWIGAQRLLTEWGAILDNLQLACKSHRRTGSKGYPSGYVGANSKCPHMTHADVMIASSKSCTDFTGTGH